MRELPTGVVTFLLTDVEGSTSLWETYPEAMRRALARHDELVETLVVQHDGVLVRPRGEGDSRFAVFPQASNGVEAAAAIQRALQREPWPLRVRMALHTGEADLRAGDYYGAAVNRCARLRGTAHGNQVLVTEAVEAVVKDALPEGVALRDLGEHRLKDLQRPVRIFQVVADGLPADFPPLKSLDILPNNLPIQLTSFIGRAREKAEVKRLLSTSRFITLTGSGGAGKTRLALEVAAEVLDEFADGVWLVEFAALSDPSLVPKAVASALSVFEQPGRMLTETLADALRGKSVLVILDNCEHLVAACAQLAGVLLRTCSNLRILATSRAALGVTGETTWRVPSLSVPDPRRLPPLDRFAEYESVRLFIDRAAASAQQFAMTRTNAPVVAQICQRLDGIPLAIELAAARVKVLAVEQIATRLDDRFRLLTGGSRTALPRHQTLRAAMDWSYALLAEAERGLLRRLSVFAGGCTLEAAEAVCGGAGVDPDAVLDLVTQLVDKSLVVVESQDAEVRYSLLETVRQYAWDRLREAGEDGEVRRRHWNWYLALAQEAQPELRGPSQATWLERLEIEHDNLRAALEWALETREAEQGLRLAMALGRFWDRRSYWSEGRKWLERLLAETGDDVPASRRAEALRSAGELARGQHDHAAARSFIEQSLSLFRETGDKGGLADSCGGLSAIRSDQGDYEGARAFSQESLTLSRELGDRRRTYLALIRLALAAVRLDDYQAARQYCTETLALARERGDTDAVAHALSIMGEATERRGDHDEAAALYARSLALYRELGIKTYIAILLTKLARVAQERGQYDAAAAQYEEALALCREIGGEWALAFTLNDFGMLAQARGDYGHAVTLHTEALAVGQAIQSEWHVAISLNRLGRTARCQGDDQQAIVLQKQSLALSQKVHSKLGVCGAVEELAKIACAQRDFERAARLCGAAEALRATIGAPLPPSGRLDYERTVATARAALGDGRFGATSQEGRGWTLDQAIAYALKEPLPT